MVHCFKFNFTLPMLAFTTVQNIYSFFFFLSVVDMNPSYVPTTGHGATSGMSRRRPLSINNRQLRYSSVGVMPHVKLDPSPAKHLLGEHNTAMTRQVTVKIAPPEMSKSPMYVLLKKM